MGTLPARRRADSQSHSPAADIVGGVTTFVTMAYIVRRTSGHRLHASGQVKCEATGKSLTGSQRNWLTIDAH
jgi:hypothetical protein